LLKINVKDIKLSNIKHEILAFYLLQRKGSFIREAGAFNTNFSDSRVRF